MTSRPQQRQQSAGVDFPTPNPDFEFCDQLMNRKMNIIVISAFFAACWSTIGFNVAAQEVNNSGSDQSTLGSTSVRQNAGQQNFDELKREMLLKWPNNRLVRFVFHGHSVPAGYFRGGQVRRFDSYPILFHQQLCELYPTAVIDVCTTAIGGENSKRGSRRFADEVLTLNPDVIFIDYCLNDRAIGVEAAHQYWRTMIEQALNNSVKVVLLTPTPDSHEDILDPETKLAKHSESVRSLGKEYGLPVVDSYELFRQLVAEGADVSDYLSQPNHPNRKGHQLVAERIVQLLQ